MCFYIDKCGENSATFTAIGTENIANVAEKVDRNIPTTHRNRVNTRAALLIRYAFYVARRPLPTIVVSLNYKHLQNDWMQ